MNETSQKLSEVADAVRELPTEVRKLRNEVREIGTKQDSSAVEVGHLRGLIEGKTLEKKIDRLTEQMQQNREWTARARGVGLTIAGLSAVFTAIILAIEAYKALLTSQIFQITG